jgi:hypothetical protein
LWLLNLDHLDLDHLLPLLFLTLTEMRTTRRILCTLHNMRYDEIVISSVTTIVGLMLNRPGRKTRMKWSTTMKQVLEGIAWDAKYIIPNL